MESAHPATAPAGDDRRYLGLILLVFVAVHGLLAVYDLTAVKSGDK